MNRALRVSVAFIVFLFFGCMDQTNGVSQGALSPKKPNSSSNLITISNSQEMPVDCLMPPSPSQSSKSARVEVLEFFWYGCPHCANLEPKLSKWSIDHRETIQLVRIPVIWEATDIDYARLYYALQLTGHSDLHQKIFDEIHIRKSRLIGRDQRDSIAVQAKFLNQFGIDTQEFEGTLLSAAMEQQVSQSKGLGKRYEIDALPTFVVGRCKLDLRTTQGDIPKLLNVVLELTKS